MALASSTVKLDKVVVGAGVPISCAMVTFDPAWIKVFYGDADLQAVYNTDYTVSVALDFQSFTVTPTAGFITKLNALGDGNNIRVVRFAPETNAMTETDAFDRANLVYEFDRLSMVALQLQYQFGAIPEDLITSIGEVSDAIALAIAAAATATTQAGIATTQAGLSTSGAATATTQAGISTTQAGLAATQAGNAATSAGTASTQAGIATTQAGNAATSAGTASTQAGIATTQAGTATTQAGVATAQAAAAAASALATATALAAMSYAFSTTTADADPGNGTLRLNNAAAASATAMYLDNLDSNAVDISALLDTADDSTNVASKAIITLRAKTNPAIYAIYSLTGSVVDGTGYRKFTLTYITGSGAFTNGLAVWLLIDRVGDKGASGAGSGDALVANPLSQFAATTSAQLRGVLSDETGTGAAVFADSPALAGTPTAPTAGAGTNTTQISTTAFVKAAIDVVLGGVSASFDTLVEIVAAMATKTGAETLTNKTLTGPIIDGTIKEDIFTIADAAAFEIDPANGSVQLITLGANRTPKGTNFAAGHSVVVQINDGTAFTLTWTDTTFGTSGVNWVGGSAPVLATTGWSVVVLWKVASQVYGKYIGDVAT